ncbi:hypothetical protein [Pseudonocardia spinosispora]|uniref:hypothetical protein n=1 Tax=Pseudonocardia spinosispora TaxID=103441 RepID=UPI0012EBBFCB|nr:hypothetical protein [Pseudonocardia spinosispora]
MTPSAQPSTNDQARDAGLPQPDHWNIAGPHPQEPTWQLPMLKSVTVLHDNHDGVLIDGQWELTTPQELEELADKLRSAAQWLRHPADHD